MSWHTPASKSKRQCCFAATCIAFDLTNKYSKYSEYCHVKRDAWSDDNAEDMDDDDRMMY